ncbi:MAG TPA: nitrogenase-stabilizing/protective protein NifW [Anaeromyxobacteraceae bacterium]|jgi:hypothetical protein|nr:nitrogenase-stabilizing/protective protein NifW [Anaeromyxobacteraceae bacterium]
MDGTVVAPRTLEAFRRLETAEEYMSFFGVRCEPAVLAAGRVQILLRFSRDLAEIDARDPAPGEAERLELYERALRVAYAMFRWASPEAERALGVLRGPGCAGCSGGSGCGP